MSEKTVNTLIAFELTRSTKGTKELKTGNEMINSNDRMHFHVKSEIASHLRQLSNIEARQVVGDLPPETCIYSKNRPCHILVHICPPTNRRTDSPNWYPTVKPLVDGLTDAHVFEDDNDQVITSFTFLPGPLTTNKKYRIVLEICEGTIYENKRFSR